MKSIQEQLLDLMATDQTVAEIFKVGSFGFPPTYTYHKHKHSEIEMFYVVDGSCRMEIQGEVVKVQRGECMVIYPQTEHNFKVDSDGTCYMAQLEFRQSFPPKLADSLQLFAEIENPAIYYAKLPNAKNIGNIIDGIAEQTKEQHLNKLGRVSLDLMFLQLFVYLSSQLEEHRRAEKKLGRDTYQKVLQYINHNYTETLNMQEICEKFDVSSRYIRRRFNEDLGMGSSQYINLLRISKAKEYLSTFHHTITDIAFMTGFTNSQYFSRVFKEHTGLSPTEYRDMVTEDTEPIL